MKKLNNEDLLKLHEKYMKLYIKINEVLDELETEVIKDRLIDIDKVKFQADLIRVVCSFDLTGLVAHVINLQEFVKSQLSYAEAMRQHLKDGKPIQEFKP